FVDEAIPFMKKAAKANKLFYVNLWPDDVHSPFWPPVDKWGNGKRELYLQVLKEMDRQFGKLFDFIREDEALRKNTLVLICSDNGREQTYGLVIRAPSSRRVLVVGAGPAGLKAGAVAAARGHQVTIVEQERVPGGQVLLAERLPGRSEFGGLVPNLMKEVVAAGAEVRYGITCDKSFVVEHAPDVVVVATGAGPRVAPIEVGEGADVVDAWDVICGSTTLGRRVVVGDWRCDWVGMGVAEMLRALGHDVRLLSTGHVAGEMLPRYVRDHWLGELHRLGVDMLPLSRVMGVDDDTVYVQHMASGEPVLVEGVDTFVSSAGHVSRRSLGDELDGLDVEVHVIGDAAAPRTAEEAVLEGLEVGTAV
ncbi:MAG: FAD-dependent oxidoreductase, partial [Actinomycetota bacterium]|nr:FAD-dependent oxidoreductase [Actinomycetota bacterium]